MKKILSVLLSLGLVICIACGFAGCEDKQIEEENRRLTEDNKKLSEEYNQLAAEKEKLDEEYNRLVEESAKLDEEYKQLDRDYKHLDWDYKQLVQEHQNMIYENMQPAYEAMKPIAENGNLYYLKNAYNCGFLSVKDLESIACRYYEFYKYEENPYSGAYTSTEELSEENEKKIIEIYAEQFLSKYGMSSEKISVVTYYGTYNGNIVAYLMAEDICIDPIIEAEAYIGGVVFKKFWKGQIFVYHF